MSLEKQLRYQVNVRNTRTFLTNIIYDKHMGMQLYTLLVNFSEHDS